MNELSNVDIGTLRITSYEGQRRKDCECIETVQMH